MVGPGGWATLKNSAGLSFCCVPYLMIIFKVQLNNVFIVHYDGELILSGDVVYFGFIHHVSAMYNLYYGLDKQPFIY
jgi:hypothetical protein